MKLTKNQKNYEMWLVRERTLSSISTTSLGLLAIPSISFYDMLVGEKADFTAFAAIVGIIALRAYLVGVLHKTRFRLKLAKAKMENETHPPDSPRG